MARTFTLAALVLGLTLLGSSPVVAQSDTMMATTTTTTTETEEDNDFPWGLLGLLGLAGLLGRRNKDVHVHEHEVHTRPVPPRDDRMGTPPPPPRDDRMGGTPPPPRV